MKLKANLEPMLPAEVIRNSHENNEFLEQVSKITKCSAFANSDILRGLLVFLAKAATDRPGENIREQEIAETVLGKSDFDARIDSGVRVHAGRLRSKLAEYYLGEGKNDPLIVELSKGSYQLVYHPRNIQPEVLTPLQTEPPAGESAASPTKKPSTVLYLFAAGIVIICLVSAWFGYKRWTLPVPQEVEMFWSPFLYGDRPPIVVFGGPRPGTARAQWAAHEDDLTFTSSWAGVGALVSVHRLTHIFTSLEKSFILKRSLNLNWDDARKETLILIGGPESNSAHSSLPKTKRFVFLMNGQTRVRTNIKDMKAKDESASLYVAAGNPIHQDYAIIAYLPTLSPDRPMVIAAGMTTFGTQAAFEFLTEKDSLKLLQNKLSLQDDRFPYFEALIRVNVRDGVPIHSELVAVEKW